MGSKKESAPSQVTPEQAAQAQMQAQISSVLPLQQAQMKAYQDPTSGLLAQNQLWNAVREQVNPEQAALQDQYIQSVMQSLQNPGALPTAYQSAIDANRAKAADDLTRQLQTQMNLGNKLYGGTGFDRLANSQQQLQNQFYEQDANRLLQQLQLAYSGANPILQAYYGQQIQTPNVQYQNAAASGDTALGSLTSQRNADMQYQLQQQANQNALYSALYGGLGQMGGAAMGGMFGAGGMMAQKGSGKAA